ncbi:MAG TPA: winged helix-turn-helix domain-containing protein [Candidatus Acidoferrum sp.]
MTPGVVPMQERYEPTSASPNSLASGRYIYLGPFQIDQQRQEITREGERLKLQGKVYQVLMALLEKPGEVVTREEIRQRLWPAETHVNFDANVNTTVNKLRLALGDSSEKPVYIETIPRKGYCLLVQPESSATPKPLAAPQPLQHAQSVALPSAAGTHSNTRVWVIAGIVGLILAGIVIGASLTRMWISHFGPVNPWP